MFPPQQFGKQGDIEAGNNGQLYPGMIEDPQMRWAFIRKIYMIISIQLILTAMVASVVVFIPPIARFIVTTPAGLACYIVLLILPMILLCPLYSYRQKHPVNLILLALFTVTFSFGVGLSCSFSKGRVVLEALILTAVVVVSLTLYTFWAAKRGHDFSFLGPILLCAGILLLVFGFMQILFPLGKISTMVFGALGALLFSGYIVYDTDNLIKRFSYDEYIWAAVSLYLDIVNLFIALLTLLRAIDG